ncbi:hypothetical protein QUF54_08715 [Candidatus Marithioploca araucensis]|uniref:Uncharacterized protein n=1 Tax=Candidatus Marithioploca araucensis TaxID=70273 RepID=A0ABT7VV15_9GAMM|nr:hypothetical protein [Candidatus Marithioploca araucensis]
MRINQIKWGEPSWRVNAIKLRRDTYVFPYKPRVYGCRGIRG